MSPSVFELGIEDAAAREQILAGIAMIHIRRMLESDHMRVHEMLCACYHWLSGREGWNREQLAFMLSDRASMHVIEVESKMQTWLVASQDGLVVGVVAVKGSEIAKLYVDPTYHHEEGVWVGSGMYVIELDAGGFRARRMAALVRF